MIFGMYVGQTMSCSRTVIQTALVFELLSLVMFSYEIVYARELRYTLR